MAKILVKNIGRLQTPIGSFKHGGKDQGTNTMLVNASVLAEDGVIVDIKTGGELPCSEDQVDEVIDAQGRLATPGLIDCHTHMVFGGYRQNELPQRVAGATAVEIARTGGGINDTVENTRRENGPMLYEKSRQFVEEMLKLGVTTCEAKSGYGLDFGNEMKLLEVIRMLNKETKMDVVSTFMGAHAVPFEYMDDPLEFVEVIAYEWLPYIKDMELAEICDIHCEEGVFGLEESEVYIEAAKKNGFMTKIHADGKAAMGGAKLAGELGCISADDLTAIDEEGMDALAKGENVAVVLPLESFYLDREYAPAKEMIKKGIPVAIGSDFNPGTSPSLNLQLAIALGCLKYKMTPEEVLTAVTINAAAALGREESIGTLEVGKKMDMVLWDAPNMEMVCYRIGSNLVHKVIKNGEVLEF